MSCNALQHGLTYHIPEQPAPVEIRTGQVGNCFLYGRYINETRRVFYCLLSPCPIDKCADACSATIANRGIPVFSWLRSTLPHYAVPCSDVSRHRKRLQRGYRHCNHRGLNRGQSPNCCRWSRRRRFSGGSFCRNARCRFLVEKTSVKYERFLAGQ